MLEANEVHVVTLSQVYDTTVEDLWDCCTNAERIPRWFLPVNGDLHLGGRYQLEGNAGGEVLECEPPHRFTATWEYGDAVSWIEVMIAAEGDRARFTLEHLALPDERWGQFGPGAVGIGWDLAMIGLVLHLASAEAVDSKAVEAWTTSPDGVRFMTDSGTAWGAADEARAKTLRLREPPPSTRSPPTRRCPTPPPDPSRSSLADHRQTRRVVQRPELR